MGVKMKIFYNFDNMYANQKTIRSVDINKIETNKEFENFELNKDVALFDYSAKATSSYLPNQTCSNVDCFEGLINQETPDNCISYNACLQYFNTMPITNCINNVPTASFLILDNQ
jgi:hypothetical protein